MQPSIPPTTSESSQRKLLLTDKVNEVREKWQRRRRIPSRRLLFNYYHHPHHLRQVQSRSTIPIFICRQVKAIKRWLKHLSIHPSISSSHPVPSQERRDLITISRWLEDWRVTDSLGLSARRRRRRSSKQPAGYSPLEWNIFNFFVIHCWFWRCCCCSFLFFFSSSSSRWIWSKTGNYMFC